MRHLDKQVELYTRIEAFLAKTSRPLAGCFSLYSITCVQTVDDPWAERAGRHIRAEPAYLLTIATIGTASRKMIVAMAKIMKCKAYR